MSNPTNANAQGEGFDANANAEASTVPTLLPKIYLVCRVVECALSFLRLPPDSSPEWGPLSGASYFSLDGEAAYQTARQNKGLKIRYTGLPDGVTMNRAALFYATVARSLGA